MAVWWQWLFGGSGCLVVVAFSSLAGIFEECSTIRSPACAFFFLSGDEPSHTDPTLYARISPQWLSELRRLWPNVPLQAVCELVSGQIPTLCLDSGIVIPLRLRWVKGLCVFMYNLLPARLAEWPRSFTCHCGNTGLNGHRRSNR